MGDMRVIAVRNTKTLYRDGDKCIKVFVDDFKKSEVLSEAFHYSVVEDAGLHVPKVLAVGTVDGYPAITYEYIKGPTLAQLMAEHPEKKSEYLDLLIDLQLEVHKKSAKSLISLKDYLSLRIQMSSIEATARYYLLSMLQDMPINHNICHGDFNPSNIIISQDGTPYIVDWTGVTQGYPALDAAETYLLFWLDGDIDGAKYYLDNFQKKAGVDKDYIQKWMPVVAASHSVGCRADQREFLIGWIEQNEYNKEF
ncbi:MAG: phosphotransferase [Clostridia bacterium]|nr:phosphotransferase [Clostridia bacterium]